MTKIDRSPYPPSNRPHDPDRIRRLQKLVYLGAGGVGAIILYKLYRRYSVIDTPPTARLEPIDIDPPAPNWDDSYSTWDWDDEDWYSDWEPEPIRWEPEPVWEDDFFYEVEPTAPPMDDYDVEPTAPPIDDDDFSDFEYERIDNTDLWEDPTAERDDWWNPWADDTSDDWAADDPRWNDSYWDGA